MARPNSAPRVDAAQRDAQALELRAAGASFRVIADRLGVSVSTAWKCVDRGLAATRHEPAVKLRTLERERLDRLTVQQFRCCTARHVVVSGGKIVVGDDGRPLVDHGPTLAAINTMVRLIEQRARLEGLDEPVRADITAKVHAEVYSVGALDRELQRLTDELAGLDPECGVSGSGAVRTSTGAWAASGTHGPAPGGWPATRPGSSATPSTWPSSCSTWTTPNGKPPRSRWSGCCGTGPDDRVR